MTQLLYIHDSHKLKRDSMGQLYTDSNYGRDVWRRYTQAADEVTAVFRQAGDPMSPEAAQESFEPIPQSGVRCVEVPDMRRSPAAFLSIKERIRRRRLVRGLVDSHDSLIVRLPSEAGSIALSYARGLGRPVMVEIVGCAWDTLWNHSVAGKLLAPWAFIRMRRSASKATHAVYVTQHFLQKRYPCPGKTLACTDVVLRPADASMVMARLDRTSRMVGRRVVLGTAGAVDVRYKGHDLVIRALARLADEPVKFEYRIAGGGDQARLKRLAAKHGVSDDVRFLGALSRAEVMEFYDGLDLYVQPSRSEGLPRALIEAMSRGCPALGSSAGGIAELLDTDAVFESGSVRNLVNALRRGVSEAFLKRQAHRNWNVAMDLQLGDIEAKRVRFLKDFVTESEQVLE